MPPSPPKKVRFIGDSPPPIKTKKEKQFDFLWQVNERIRTRNDMNKLQRDYINRLKTENKMVEEKRKEQAE